MLPHPDIYDCHQERTEQSQENKQLQVVADKVKYPFVIFHP